MSGSQVQEPTLFKWVQAWQEQLYNTAEQLLPSISKGFLVPAPPQQSRIVPREMTPKTKAANGIRKKKQNKAKHQECNEDKIQKSLLTICKRQMCILVADTLVHFVQVCWTKCSDILPFLGKPKREICELPASFALCFRDTGAIHNIKNSILKSSFSCTDNWNVLFWIPLKLFYLGNFSRYTCYLSLNSTGCSICGSGFWGPDSWGTKCIPFWRCYLFKK